MTDSSQVDNATVNVQQDLCRGHGRCYSLFPDIFESDDQSMSHVIADAAPAAEARQAAANCPESAITVRVKRA